VPARFASRSLRHLSAAAAHPRSDGLARVKSTIQKPPNGGLIKTVAIARSDQWKLAMDIFSDINTPVTNLIIGGYLMSVLQKA
jgi:hypothetical protein